MASKRLSPHPCVAIAFLALSFTAISLRRRTTGGPCRRTPTGDPIWHARATRGQTGRGRVIPCDGGGGLWAGGSVQLDGQKRLGWVLARTLQQVAGKDGSPASAQDMARIVGSLIRKGVRVHCDAGGHVHFLDGEETSVQDGDLADCAQFDRMVGADFSETEVGDAGLAHLVQSGSLERLYLKNTQVTGQALAQLAPLQQLEVLVLAGTKVRGGDLAQLAAVPTLRTLNIARCEVADGDLVHLEPLVNLEVLVISGTQLAGPGLAHLKPLSRLRVLNISETPVTDDALVHLEWAPSLRMIYVRETKLTTAATDELDKTLTSCSIYHE